jgi:hypothetical protein
MASIRLNCPACGRTLEVDAEAAGKEVECGECLEVFVAKAPEGNIRGTPSPSGKIPAATPRSKPARKPSRRRDDDDDDDYDDDYDLPSARRGRGGVDSGAATAGLILGIIALLTSCCPLTGIILGILAVVLGSMGRTQSGGESGTATAAFILGLLALVISVGLLILWMAGGGFNRFGN